jgi:hypothetical protein
VLISLCGSAYAAKDIDQPRMTKAINAIPMKPLWRAVRVDELKPNAVNLTILYKAMPESYEPEQDTMAVARVVLKELVAEGKQPSADWTILHVSAMQDGLKGETGVALVRVFGTTDYRFADDALTWRRWTGSFWP